MPLLIIASQGVSKVSIPIFQHDSQEAKRLQESGCSTILSHSSILLV
jgi:hypothetical protein